MTAPTGLRAISLQAENVKRLRAIDVTLGPGLQVISGRNGQGKTSAIDALWLALGGGRAQADMPAVVRRGERSAQVKVQLGRGDGAVELIVTRTWKGDGNGTLKVMTPEGAAYPKAQTTLDDLVGALSFDPLAFLAAKPAEQRHTLLGLVTLPFDVDEVDRRIAGARAQRTEVNREVKRLDSLVASLPAPVAGLPDAEVSTADLLAQHRAASEAHRQREGQGRQLVECDQRIVALEEELVGLRQARTQLLGLIEQAPALPDLAAIEARMAGVDETNAKVRANAARARAEAERATVAAQADELTATVTALEQRKADGLATAAMPIEGLGVDSDGVTYKGLPLTQASGAEQLRVSLAIATAANPTLRLMLIRDGSLLDPDSLAIVERFATANDVQVIVERVAGSGGPVGIVIEDGMVAEDGAIDALNGDMVDVDRLAGPVNIADFGWLDDDAPDGAA